MEWWVVARYKWVRIVCGWKTIENMRFGTIYKWKEYKAETIQELENMLDQADLFT